MKIGFLLPGFSARSDDWAIPVQQNLAREIAKSHELRIIPMRYPATKTPYSLDGAAVYPIGGGSYTRGIKRLTLWLETLRKVEELHRVQPFDVLHAMWADETGLVAAWAGRRLKIPVVVSVLGGELVGMPELGYGLQRSQFSRWVVGRALKGANRVIVPSHYVRQLLSKSGYRIRAEKIVPITLGVDAERFTPLDTPGNPRRLIHVASLIPIKDQVTLLKAVALLDSSVTLEVIGDGTERERLERLAGELGVQERVRFAGAVAHPDLPRYYQQAGLNVLSSRHETIAMTTLEAAACGVPTVSTDVGIVPDYPELGFIVPVGDAIEMATAIQELINDPKQYEALRKSARALAQNKLSIQTATSRLSALYGALVREERKASPTPEAPG